MSGRSIGTCSAACCGSGDGNALALTCALCSIIGPFTRTFCAVFPSSSLSPEIPYMGHRSKQQLLTRKPSLSYAPQTQYVGHDLPEEQAAPKDHYLKSLGHYALAALLSVATVTVVLRLWEADLRLPFIHRSDAAFTSVF